jgi:hypothetical protein
VVRVSSLGIITPAPGDRVVVLVATKSGLFLFTSDKDRRTWHRSGPSFAGCDVSRALFDARDGAAFASTDGGDSWQTLVENRPGVHAVKVAYAG